MVRAHAFEAIARSGRAGMLCTGIVGSITFPRLSERGAQGYHVNISIAKSRGGGLMYFGRPKSTDFGPSETLICTIGNERTRDGARAAYYLCRNCVHITQTFCTVFTCELIGLSYLLYRLMHGLGYDIDSAEKRDKADTELMSLYRWTGFQGSLWLENCIEASDASLKGTVRLSADKP